MLSVILAVCLSTAISESSLNQSYADAYRESVRDHKPLMVVVGAPYCPACKVLKQTTIQPMAATGELRDVSVAVVDKERDPKLAERLTGGEKLLPQIIVFSQDASGAWKRRKLLGYQPKQPVRSLIRRARGR
ncbi:MAG: thioredoxin family protein [Planctomycetota bacterium]